MNKSLQGILTIKICIWWLTVLASIQKFKIVPIYNGGQGEILQVQKYPKTKKISMNNSNFEKNIHNIHRGDPNKELSQVP